MDYFTACIEAFSNCLGFRLTSSLTVGLLGPFSTVLLLLPTEHRLNFGLILHFSIHRFKIFHHQHLHLHHHNHLRYHYHLINVRLQLHVQSSAPSSPDLAQLSSKVHLIVFQPRCRDVFQPRCRDVLE